MKLTILFILAAATLLVGCHHQQQWEYRVVEYGNSADSDITHLFLNGTNLPAGKWLEQMDEAKSSEGFFRFDLPPEQNGITNTDRSMDDLGKDGWELVSVAPQLETIGTNTRTANFFLFYKRLR